MDLVSLLTSTTSKGNPNAWDISKAYYDAGADAWDLSKAFYSNVSFSVAAQEALPTGLFFKPDGTKMYITGSSGDDINEYTLSTPWLVSSATYVQNFSVTAQESSPQDTFFKPDGTKMYIVGSIGDDVNEYDLSTAWDISTASYLQNFSVSAQETEPLSLFFKPDGTKMYVMGTTDKDVNEYDLSSAWDISTAVYLQNFSIAGQEINSTGLFFKPDGTKMYITGSTGDDVNEYDLSTPWDISTASYVQNFSVATQETSPQSLFFHPNGSGFYVVGAVNDTVYQYTIGGFSVAAQETTPNGIFFKPDGTKMYVTGVGNDKVYEYTVSTAWDITSASFLQDFSISAQEDTSRDIFFKPDGTKMYIVGIAGDDVNEYDLSSAWDISTASYLQVFSVAAQNANPVGLFFKPDGTKMYIAGQSSPPGFYEYSLSSAWDISTATYVTNFSTASQTGSVQCLFFKPDGTKVYVNSTSPEGTYEYDLSTAWDISSASFVQSLTRPDGTTSPRGLFFKPDGTQFWYMTPTLDRAMSYLISPE